MKRRCKIPYLAGSMTGLKGYGRPWRAALKKWLVQHHIHAYDPCIEETKEHQQYDLSSIKKHRWESFPQSLQEAILLQDLAQIEFRTNYVICYFTKYSTGTVSELTFARYLHVPVYIVTNRKLIGWPHTVGHTPGNYVFKSFKELKRFLTWKYKLKKIK